MPQVTRVSSRPTSVRRAIRTTSRPSRKPCRLPGSASRLDRVDEIGDDFKHALGQLDELDARAVREHLLVHVADAAVGDASFDDDRALAEREAKFVQGVDVQGEGGFELDAAAADFLDRGRLEHHNLAVELAEDWDTLGVS